MERTMLAIFVRIQKLKMQKFVKILLQKMTLIIIFNKYKQSEVFREKNRNVLPNNHNFSPAMHGLGISLINKRSSRQEKKYVCN